MYKEMLPSGEEARRLGYSQGVRVNNLLLISGQVALDEKGEIVGKGDFKTQARKVFQNLKSVVERAGGQLEDVVKITVYITDIRYLEEFRKIRGEYFKEWFPASTLVEVGALIKSGLMLEIDAIAVIRESTKASI